MRIQAYLAYSGVFTVTVSTIRPEAARSTLFTAATAHEDFAAKVRGLLEEHIHIAPTDRAFPDAKRLQYYFPVATINGVARPIYAMKELMPAGAPRDVDANFMLEITRLRYQFSIALLKEAFAVTPTYRSAIERAIEFAVQSLFFANTVPWVYAPGDETVRPQNPNSTTGPTDVDILCELGPASQRQGIDIPDPVSP